jgi:hypothetical protein
MRILCGTEFVLFPVFCRGADVTGGTRRVGKFVGSQTRKKEKAGSSLPTPELKKAFGAPFAQNDIVNFYLDFRDLTLQHQRRLVAGGPRFGACSRG